MNIEATETLAFTYNRPFHTSQRHSKLSMNHLKIWKHLGKCTNGKLPNSSLVNDRFRISTNNVKISDLLEFLLILLFSSLWSHPKTICRKLQDYENIHGGDSFLKTSKKHFVSIYTCNFAKTYLNGYFPVKLPLVNILLRATLMTDKMLQVFIKTLLLGE